MDTAGEDPTAGPPVPGTGEAHVSSLRVYLASWAKTHITDNKHHSPESHHDNILKL